MQQQVTDSSLPPRKAAQATPKITMPHPETDNGKRAQDRPQQRRVRFRGEPRDRWRRKGETMPSRDFRLRAALLPLAVLLAAVLAAGMFGCSGDKSTNSGTPPDDTSGRYLITGTFQNLLVQDGTIEVFVTRIESGDASAKNATVTLNGTTVPMRALLSTDETSIYAMEGFDYKANQSYTVSVTMSGKSSSCTFTAPVSDPPVITAPADNSLFVPGQPLTVSWEYDGDNGDPDQVFLRAAPVEDEEDNYYEEELAGSTTSRTIPGTETATWIDTEVLLTVDLGEKAWPFSGDLQTVGSGMATVLPGDALIVRNSQGPSGGSYSLQTVVYPPTIEADGASTAELTVSIFDQSTSDPCPDGTALTIVAEPAALVTLNPQAATTAGGTGSVTITAGTTTGIVTLTVTAPALDHELQGSATLVLTEPSGPGYQIVVGTGAHPNISWTPADGMAALLITEAELGVENAGWSISRKLIGGSWIVPPLTYGTVPSGATQLVPPEGSPIALTPGTSYKVWLTTMTGAVHTQIFTP